MKANKHEVATMRAIVTFFILNYFNKEKKYGFEKYLRWVHTPQLLHQEHLVGNQPMADNLSVLDFVADDKGHFHVSEGRLRRVSCAVGR